MINKILTNSKTEHKYDNYFILIVLALFSIDFYLIGKYLILIAFLILLIQKFRSKIILNFDFFVLVLFSLCYFAFTFFFNDYSLDGLSRSLTLPLAYFIGLNLYYNTTLYEIKKVLILIAIFMTLHGLLNFYYNIQLFGINNVLSISRSYDFWSGEISSSTSQATKFTIFISVFFSLMYFEENFNKKLAYFIIFFITTFYNFELGGRSYIILSGISFLISSFIYIFFSPKISDKIKKLNILIFFIAIIGIIFLLIYSKNIFGVRDLIKSSYLYHRFFSGLGQEITEDSRISKKLKYINNLFIYPWGGRHISNSLGIGSAHELWLDIFDDAGIFSLILTWIYTIRSFIRLYYILRNKLVELDYKVMFGSFYIVLNIQFFVEPILAGSPKLLLAYCIIDGMLSRYIYCSNNKLKFYSRSIDDKKNI